MRNQIKHRIYWIIRKHGRQKPESHGETCWYGLIPLRWCAEGGLECFVVLVPKVVATAPATVVSVAVIVSDFREYLTYRVLGRSMI